MLRHLVETLIAFGPLGLFVLGILDSVGIPLPAVMDALLIGVAIKTPDRAYFSAAVAVIGSLGGNILLFRAARLGRRLLADPEKAGPRQQRFRRWFDRYGLLTVFVPAVVPFVPLPLKVFVVSAGAMHTPTGRFVAVILAARVLRYFGEAWLGIVLGEHAQGFLRQNAWSILGVLLAMALAFVIALRWYDRRKAYSE